MASCPLPYQAAHGAGKTWLYHPCGTEVPRADYCLGTPPLGGGGLFGALASPGRPTHPPTHIRKIFPRQKMKFLIWAGILRPGLRTHFFWASDLFSLSNSLPLSNETWQHNLCNIMVSNKKKGDITPAVPASPMGSGNTATQERPHQGPQSREMVNGSTTPTASGPQSGMGWGVGGAGAIEAERVHWLVLLGVHTCSPFEELVDGGGGGGWLRNPCSVSVQE